MLLRNLALLLASVLSQHHVAIAQPTWPASTDELEDIMMLNDGYRARRFADAVTPCSKGASSGRFAAAEFIRTAFHDMATGSVFTNVGGLDGSIAFELRSGENIGAAFATTLSTYAPYFSNLISLADIIAVGVYTATRACGGPIVPIRGGRKDATTAGSTSGIPVPQNPIGTFRNQFERIGYTPQQMIALVACGHTLGAVHIEDFPDIAPGSLDSTPDVFDNKIATEFVGRNSKDPLGTWGTKKNSDFVVFTSDNNATINSLTDARVFQDTCRDMFQKMIEVVPAGVVLSDPVVPYEVKPSLLQLTLLDGGTQIRFTGEVRVRTTSRSVSRVQLLYKDRSGSTSSDLIATTVKGTASGFDDTFAFYGFEATLATTSSISTFNVIVQSGSATEIFDNNGSGFRVDDSVIFQEPQSCLDGSGQLTAVAAVRTGAQPPQLIVIVKSPRASPNPIPSLSTANAPMASQSAVGEYQLYSGSYTFAAGQADGASFGVFAGSASDKDKKTSNLPTACVPLGTSPPTSTPTPSAFTFQGCYSDNAATSRALSGPVSADDTMTLEKCVDFCSKYQLFGLEYGRECYCGNELDASSKQLDILDCNMPCAGNQQQTCGAGNRMSLYKNNKYIAPTNPPVKGYKYFGCYSEGINARALGGASKASGDMSVEICSDFCNGSNYFGLEYGQECYCGSSIHETSTSQPDNDCSMTCAGNSTEWCGAAYRLNVYQKVGIENSTSSSSIEPTSSSSPGTIVTSSIASTATTSTPINSNILSETSPPPSTTTTTTTPPPPPIPTLAGYTYEGCFPDDPASRLLRGKSREDTSNTLSSCAAFCTDYQYLGVEYGAECYCGARLPSPPISPDDDAQCNVPCPGNPANDTSTCGAGFRIAVFKSITPFNPTNPVVEGYNHTGCFEDSVGARLLTGATFFDGGGMSVSKCAGLCKGFRLFGTEFGGECYCGDEFAGEKKEVGGEECEFVCPGDSGEFCGGAGRVNVWERVGGGNGTAALRVK